jgi:hypothetical protein
MSQTSKTPRIYRLPKKNTNPTKKGVVFPPSVSIPPVDEIYEEYKDEEGNVKGRKRIIQYSKGERTIYRDEQSKDAKPSKVPTITEGFLIVSYRETLLIDFLDKCNWNKSNTNRDEGASILFQGVEKGQDAAEYVRIEKQKWSHHNKIFTMSPDELEALALVVNIGGWEDKTTEELQRDLLVVANRDPAFFDKVLLSSDSKKKFQVVKATKMGIIKLDQGMCTASWASGREICQGSLSDNIESYLVQYFESKQGEEAYTHMLGLMNPGKKVEEPKKEKPQEKEKSNNLSSMTSDELLKEALLNSVIVLEGPFYKYKKGTVEETKVKGKKEFSAKFMDDEDYRAGIIADLESLVVA